MKRILIALMLSTSVVFPSMAEETLTEEGFATAANLDNELNQEIDGMYADNGWGGETQIADEQIVAAPNSNSGDKIYIVNQARPVINTGNSKAASSSVNDSEFKIRTRVQTQPTTLIQANPLTESRADRLRKKRQNMELQTELRIVEKLEASRMEDEKRRAEALFGDKHLGQPTREAVSSATPVDVEEQTQQDISKEIQSAVADLKLQMDGVKTKKISKPKRTYFMNGIAGLMEYPSAVNIKTKGALGASFGMQQRKLVIEGTFLYSNYEVEEINSISNFGGFPRIIDVDQFSFGASGRYQILSGLIRPYAGAGINFGYRTFTQTQYFLNPAVANPADEDLSSYAIDAGLLVGVDLAFSEDFAIGLDARYYTNVTSWSDSDQLRQSFVNPLNGGTPVEEIDYYIMALTARFNF